MQAVGVLPWRVVTLTRVTMSNVADSTLGPPPSAEVLLLALYAAHFDLPAGREDLDGLAEALALRPHDLDRLLRELEEEGLVEEDAAQGTVRLTALGSATFFELAEAGLPAGIIESRSLQEQAEALLISRLAAP